MIPPILSAAKVEHEEFALLLVLHQEGERGHVHGFMAFLYRLHKGSGGHDDVCGGVYDMNLDCVVAFGEVEGRVRLCFDLLVCHGE